MWSCRLRSRGHAGVMRRLLFIRDLGIPSRTPGCECPSFSQKQQLKSANLSSRGALNTEELRHKRPTTRQPEPTWKNSGWARSLGTYFSSENATAGVERWELTKEQHSAHIPSTAGPAGRGRRQGLVLSASALRSVLMEYDIRDGAEDNRFPSTGAAKSHSLRCCLAICQF